MKTIIISLFILNSLTFAATNSGSGFGTSIAGDIINFFTELNGNSTMTNSDKNEDDKLILDKTISTELSKTLTVNIQKGNVNINSHSRNEVIVKIYANDKAESQFDFTAIQTSGGAEVTTKPKSDEDLKGVRIKVVVTVPKDYNTDINTKGGNIDVNELNGFVHVNTMGGNITISKVNGDIDGSTKGGNISVNGITGAVDVSTLGGNVSVMNFAGKVDAETKGGNIALTGKDGEINAKTFGGNIDLDYTGVNRGIDVSTKAGSITLTLPSDINANTEMKTSVGSIRSDFGEAKKKTMSSELNTTLGTGGNMLKAKTFAGDIIVVKR